MTQRKRHIKRALAVASLILLTVLLVFITIKLWPFVMSLTEEQNRLEIKEYLSSRGLGGAIILLSIQIIQIVIAIIPGEPIELLAGLMYGSFGGLLICLLGILIGSAIVFFTIRKFGDKIIKFFVSENKIKELKFLHNAEKLELVTFIIFFIPGTPKDTLTYFAGLTPIKPIRFLIISTFARIPSVITSTIVGDQFGEGNFMTSLIIFIVFGLIGVLGIVFHKKFVSSFSGE